MAYQGSNLPKFLDVPTNGLLVQVSSDVWSTRSIAIGGNQATSGSLTIANASGTAANPTLNLSLTATDITGALTFTPANIASPTFTGTVTAPTVNIDGGTIDGTVIGSSIAAAATVTSLTASGTTTILGTLTGSGLTNYLSAPPPIGNTTSNTGSFTNLTASGTVSGAGFTALLGQSQFGAPYSAWRAGCVGDGITDDTANLITAKANARAAGVELRLAGLVGNKFKITSPITLVSGDQIVGVGTGNSVTGGSGGSILLASGNFAALINAPSISSYRIQNLVLDTNNTTTKALNITGTATTNAFCLISNVISIGSAAGTLVYSSESLVQIRDCGFFGGNTATVLLQLDGNNLNTTVHDSWFIGGSGITVTNTGAPGMISNQGIQIKNNVFANFNGPYNILIGGAAAYVTILGNVLDQAAGPALILTGSVTNITVQSNYLGQITPQVAVLDINETCANIYILGNTFGNGAYNIIIGATTSSRSGLIVIDNNNFNPATVKCLSLDSVNNCRVTNNVDSGTVPSYQILKTNSSGGAYMFGGNTWSTAAVSILDTTATFKASPDRGVTLANKGVATAGSGTSLVISHGLAVAPTTVQVTLQNGALTTYTVSAVGATTFTVTWAVSGSQQINWSAERL